MKKRLLPVKEVRALAERQRLKIQELELKLNAAKNEIESLEGARANLKMMYDTHEAIMKQAVHEKVQAMASLVAFKRDFDVLCEKASLWKVQALAVERMTSKDHFAAGLKKIAASIEVSLSRFFNFIFRRGRSQ